MTTFDITCKTQNVNRPVFHSMVAGVLLESESLSKVECLITNVYPESKFNYEFDRDMKYFRTLVKRNDALFIQNGMTLLDNDYVQQLSGVFQTSMFINTIRIYDIHGDVIAEHTRTEYKAGKFPTL